jgi:hypothetical protein
MNPDQKTPKARTATKLMDRSINETNRIEKVNYTGHTFSLIEDSRTKTEVEGIS